MNTKRLLKEFSLFDKKKYKEIGHFINDVNFIQNENNSYASYILFENILIIFNKYYPFKAPRYYIKYNSYFVEINTSFYSLFCNYENKLELFKFNDNIDFLVRSYDNNIDLKINLQDEKWSPAKKFIDNFNLIEILIKKTRNTKLILSNKMKEIKLKELFPFDNNEFSNDIIILYPK